MASLRPAIDALQQYVRYAYFNIYLVQHYISAQQYLMTHTHTHKYEVLTFVVVLSAFHLLVVAAS
jgi:hypothetical protein